MLLYILIFIISILFSAFFSSAETSLLSLDKIKLNLKAKKKKSKKALLLARILKEPDEFFSTILIGNNFVNIAAASISTVLFSKLIAGSEQLTLLVSTVVTTIVILLFAEIIPKSYAFRYNEKMSYIYAYPIKFFTHLFYPFVKITTFFSNLVFRKKHPVGEEKGRTIEEIKDFLSSQVELFKYHRESLRMVYEIIDIAEKDIKSIMTPRLNITALEDSAGIDELKKIILTEKISKIPVYRDNIDHITGIIHASDILSSLLKGNFDQLNINNLSRPPIFISEYSSLNYALNQFKEHGLNLAVIVDEYGATIGIITLNDIFSEILGEIKIGRTPIEKTAKNTFIIKGSIPVEEVNEQLQIELPVKVDYTTMSGLFVYHFGKFPAENNRVGIKDYHLTAKRMGKRKIEEILLIDQSHG